MKIEYRFSKTEAYITWENYPFELYCVLFEDGWLPFTWYVKQDTIHVFRISELGTFTANVIDMPEKTKLAIDKLMGEIQ